ncbi:MAG: phosphoketolase family protein, partial [Acidimicrobiia bacterium]
MGPVADDGLDLLDAYWRAANYLTVGQIYLQDNPLLREPLTPEHIKPRLLGHWGTSPGLSLIYAHLNRVIRARDSDVIYITGPGHGGPALLANVWLEGTYSEVYREVSRDAPGMHRLFRQFSTPGGVPSHVSVPTPGSIHEGGELGYALMHAFGAAFDNPELVVACVIGDGEAETAPLNGSWQGIDFLNPARDGAVLPILHLNGYKISGPTVLGRASDEAIVALLGGWGYDVRLVEGDDPAAVHRDVSATLDSCFDAIAEIQRAARADGITQRPRWPAIVLRTPKGWTGPKVVDGEPVEGTWRAHQVPLAEPKTNPDHLRMLEEWMRSYRPDELFDDAGRPRGELTALAPDGARRMGANPHANGGLLLEPLVLPDYSGYAIEVRQRGADLQESTRRLGELMRDIFVRNADAANFRLFCPDETNSNRL